MDPRNALSRLLHAPLLARVAQHFAERRLAASAPPQPDRDAAQIPIPPAFLMTMVAGSPHWETFQRTGLETINAIKALLLSNGGDLAATERILDFGCGCGRLARHVPDFSDGDLYGIDYNRRLVKWCERNLKGTYRHTGFRPPLPFRDDMFDLVWLISVFTHLQIDSQNRWLTELKRVTAPGGYCVISFHDEDHPSIANTRIARESLIAAGTAVHNARAEGSNYLASYQTRAYVREQFGRHFDVVEVAPRHTYRSGQSLALLRA